MATNKVVISMFATSNAWMYVDFTVDAADEQKAREVLNKAWDAYWDDDEAANECYGDWLEYALKAAHIEYEASYAPSDSDEYDYEEETA